MLKYSDIIGDEMKVITNNKKAGHNFFVSDLLEAGVELKGSEIKSVSGGKISLSESYVVVKDGQVFLKNCYIAPTQDSQTVESETRRTRKLLLHKEEIKKLERQVVEKGFTIVATKAYFKNGKVKIEIGLAKGKKLYDKRQVLRDRAIKRDIDRVIKSV